MKSLHCFAKEKVDMSSTCPKGEKNQILNIVAHSGHARASARNFEYSNLLQLWE